MNDRNLKTSVKDCIDNLIETSSFPELYRTYAWKRDVWQNGFPDICRLEREIGGAARAGTLSGEHLKAIARWGGLPNIERIRAPAPIRIALFEDGMVARWVRENPENAIRVLAGQIRGFGPTYTSKLLRFAAPELFGAHLRLLDLTATPVDGRWAILSGQPGWPEEYGTWTAILTYAAAELNAAGQLCPHPEALINAGLRERGIWLNADVEMAFFNYASGRIQNMRRD